LAATFKNLVFLDKHLNKQITPGTALLTGFTFAGHPKP